MRISDWSSDVCSSDLRADTAQANAELARSVADSAVTNAAAAQQTADEALARTDYLAINGSGAHPTATGPPAIALGSGAGASGGRSAETTVGEGGYRKGRSRWAT